MSCEIRIENFEGPLDLLLHLIKKNEMDIYDIPVAEITAQYLTYLDAMQSLNLDVASEFLVMAATLIHIKSRLLLPQAAEDEPAEEEEEDPRAELVRRLLEYQRYKAAAGALDEMPQLGRDLFARAAPAAEPQVAEEEATGFEAVGLYDLVAAFRRILQEAPQEVVHEVLAERLSVTDRVNGILGQLSGRESLAFGELFTARPERQEVVVTFLAMLELVRLRLVRLLQSTRFGTIWLYPAVIEESDAPALDEDALGYA
jgi:segregation and condensation protein A